MMPAAWSSEAAIHFLPGMTLPFSAGHEQHFLRDLLNGSTTSQSTQKSVSSGTTNSDVSRTASESDEQTTHIDTSTDCSSAVEISSDNDDWNRPGPSSLVETFPLVPPPSCKEVKRKYRHKNEPMTDLEMEFVERAHRNSKFLEIYAEPSMRFATTPPMSFVLPILTYGGESSGYQTAQSGSSSPLSPNEKQIPGFSIANGQTSVVNGGIAQSVGLLSSVQAQRKPSAPPPTESSAPFEVSKMDVLSEEIWHYYNTVTQTDKMLNKKLHLRDMLYYSISPVFPMCGLYVVGSSLNGFGNNSSDMDLCLMITNKDLDQKTDAVVVLNMIFSALSNLEWVANQKLILAKVPILRVKFSAPFDDITVDLNANNSVAIRNTHLLCYYSSFDWRVRPLVSIVKEWAKRKGINDANRSSFTSYSLVLMVLHYLQCGMKSAVLPSLQHVYPKRFYNKVDVRTLNVTHPLQTMDDWSSNETATLGELLIGFLDYYANTFNYDQDAISVRLGRRVERAAMARQKPNNAAHAHHHSHWRAQWRCICIEEPFTHSNTAHSIYDEMVFNAIKHAFQEAHQVLDRTRDLQSLLNTEPIQVNPSVGAGAVVYHGSYDGSQHVTVPVTPTSASSTLVTARTPISSKGSPSASVALVPSGSANSLNTAHSDSSASSSNGDEENDRFVNVKSTLETVTHNLEKPTRNRHSRRRTNGSRNQHLSLPGAGPV